VDGRLEGVGVKGNAGDRLMATWSDLNRLLGRAGARRRYRSSSWCLVIVSSTRLPRASDDARNRGYETGDRIRISCASGGVQLPD
jgi:hypothetical protein